MFVHGARFQRGKDVSGKKFFAQIFDDDLAGASRVRLLHDCFDIVTLADVADHGDDVVVVVFFEPWNDDGSIESAGIGEDDFVRHERS